MTPTSIDVDAVRLALQAQSVTFTVRVVALIGAVSLFITVFEAVRRRKIREDFTPIWLTCATAILFLSLSFDALIWFTNLIGAWTPSATVFFFGLAFVVAVSLGYAVRLSTLSSQVKTLAQEIAILKAATPASRSRE